MSNMLVTGGAGFIGANFVRFWNSRKPDDEIIVLDALTYAGNAANLDELEGVELIHGDIRDYALVEGLLKDRTIDTNVPFAAESHADCSCHGPDALVATKFNATTAPLKGEKEVRAR